MKSASPVSTQYAKKDSTLNKETARKANDLSGDGGDGVSQGDKTGHKEMELAVEGRQGGFCRAGGYYLFLLLSKTLRSVVTIEMFYLTRCFRGADINVRGRVRCFPACCSPEGSSLQSEWR